MNWGKAIEIVRDVIELILDAVAFAKSDPDFNKDWDELMSDILDLTGGGDVSGVTGVSGQPGDVGTQSVTDEPFMSADGTLWPTQEMADAHDTLGSQPRTVRRLSKSQRG